VLREAPVTDATASPINTTTRDAALDPKKTSSVYAPEGAREILGKEDQSPTEAPAGFFN
jgi:hypothetical protein